jgi:N-methylhydantoinase A
MLACFLARELRMKEVVVPLTPGVLSALGGLIADLKNDFIKTVYLDLAPGTDEVIRSDFAALRERALKWLREDQGYKGEYALSYSAEMRYRGQSFEIDTALNEAAIEAGDIEALGRAFHAEHERIYGHSDPHAPMQVVTVRLVISGKTKKPEIPKRDLQPGPAERAGEIEVYLDGRSRMVGLYHRKTLVAGQTLDGPAVVAQDDCTTIVPPGFTLAVDAYGNLRITAGAVQ